MEIKVKLLLSRGMEMPAYATDGSAAVDLRAAIEADTTLTIAPGERALIPTGLAISPESKNVVAIIAARSGLAIKKGICLANSIGVIDSDYRGEICVGLLNTSKEPFSVARGDRIAQMMFMPVYAARFLQVDSLDDTERGTGGFGSTGVK
ncbi:MAG: dUTP diphosphatase [Ruminococcaceae bacterium]|nr:dUTP diphosphatase [Oscillospiraceae bacterium]